MNNNWNKGLFEKNERIEKLKEQHREYFSTNYSYFTPKKLKNENK